MVLLYTDTTPSVLWVIEYLYHSGRAFSSDDVSRILKEHSISVNSGDVNHIVREVGEAVHSHEKWVGENKRDSYFQRYNPYIQRIVKKQALSKPPKKLSRLYAPPAQDPEPVMRAPERAKRDLAAEFLSDPFTNDPQVLRVATLFRVATGEQAGKTPLGIRPYRTNFNRTELAIIDAIRANPKPFQLAFLARQRMNRVERRNAKLISIYRLVKRADRANRAKREVRQLIFDGKQYTPEALRALHRWYVKRIRKARDLKEKIAHRYRSPPPLRRPHA